MPVGFFLSVSVALYLEPGIFDDSFTLENYARLVRDDYALGVLTDTLRISAYVTVLCLVLGYPLAMFIARETGFVRRAVMIVTVASLFTNLVVRTYGWLVFLTPRGLFNNMLLDAGLIEKPLRLMFNETGVIVGLVQIMLPIQIIVLAVSLQAIDKVLEDAASIAGAGKVRIFTRIIWPLSLPGVISGSILVFTLSMSSFITPEFLGGGPRDGSGHADSPTDDTLAQLSLRSGRLRNVAASGHCHARESGIHLAARDAPPRLVGRDETPGTPVLSRCHCGDQPVSALADPCRCTGFGVTHRHAELSAFGLQPRMVRQLPCPGRVYRVLCHQRFACRLCGPGVDGGSRSSPQRACAVSAGAPVSSWPGWRSFPSSCQPSSTVPRSCCCREA